MGPGDSQRLGVGVLEFILCIFVPGAASLVGVCSVRSSHISRSREAEDWSLMDWSPPGPRLDYDHG